MLCWPPVAGHTNTLILLGKVLVLLALDTGTLVVVFEAKFIFYQQVN